MNRVDLPTFGRPTMPALRLMLSLEPEDEKSRRHCQRRRSDEEPEQYDDAEDGCQLSPIRADPKTLAAAIARRFALRSVAAQQEKRTRETRALHHSIR